MGMEDPRSESEKSEPLDVEAALLSRETAESLEKIFNVLMKLNLANNNENEAMNEGEESEFF